MKFFPSLISADILNLRAVLKALDPHVDGYHIDVMDNHFVPNLTWGHAFINALASATERPLWVHLMVDNTLSLLERMDLHPGSTVSFHAETKEDIKTIIAHIKEKNWLASCALKPYSAPALVEPYLSQLDQLLVMSVNPGFSGQQFIASALDRIEYFKKLQATTNDSFTIACDGGITAHNIAPLAALGVSEVAVAQALFAHGDAVQALATLKKWAKK